MVSGWEEHQAQVRVCVEELKQDEHVNARALNTTSPSRREKLEGHFVENVIVARGTVYRC